MVQIIGKSSPLRGLTVLLALMPVVLMLGAGLALSGCGGDDSTTTTPAAAPAPPAPAPTPTLDAPGGLTVASSGTDYIEFSWEAVEGASGYEIQLSTTEGDFSSVSTASVTGTMHRFSVAPGTTAYARVRAVSDEANDSDWTEAVTGMSNAAPLVLGVPTVRVKATGVDFVEWEWDAVENAQGYQLQVADSEDGFEMAELETVTATSHRVTVEPETTMYIRVRAEVAPATGDWSAAVMATSDLAPSPLLVSMSTPDADDDKSCMGQAFCPDDGKDAETAMATVNTKMVVTSSHSARVTPMFMEGAPSINVVAGSDTPFTYVSWSAKQVAVTRDGAVFMFEKVTTVGAGQEAMPTGDVVYITCGPFRCSDAAMEAPAAPAITLADSAACDEFEATLNLVKGLVNNWEARGGNLGVDVGFTYTATHGATVTHEFSDVSFGGGGPYRVRGATISATSTPMPLVMAASGSGNTARNHFGGADNRNADPNDQSEPGPIRNGTNDCFVDTALPQGFSYAANNISLDRSAQGTPGKHNLTGTAALKKPENCVRLITDGVYDDVGLGKQTVRFRDYVSGYRVHINPAASVAWGGSSVTWSSLDDDPFDGLTCPSRPFEVADMVDACGDFQAEVDAYWGKGIGAGGQFRVEYTGSGIAGTARLDNIVIRNRADSNDADRDAADAYRPRDARHAHLWLVDATVTTTTSLLGIDGTRQDHDLYSPDESSNARHGAGTRGTEFGAAGNWRPIMSIYMFDVDGDPQYGDFGKTDFDRPGSTGYGTADNTTTINDAASRRCSSSDGGAGCDAEMTFDLSATFTRIKDTDTCTRTIEQSITCTWDADGDRRRGGATDGWEAEESDESTGIFIGTPRSAAYTAFTIYTDTNYEASRTGSSTARTGWYVPIRVPTTRTGEVSSSAVRLRIGSATVLGASWGAPLTTSLATGNVPASTYYQVQTDIAASADIRVEHETLPAPVFDITSASPHESHFIECNPS